MKVGAMRRRLKHVLVVGGRTDAFDESVPDGPYDDWKCSLAERCPVPLVHILTRPYFDGDITSCMYAFALVSRLSLRRVGTTMCDYVTRQSCIDTCRCQAV